MTSLGWDKTKRFVGECALKGDPIKMMVGIIVYPLIPFVVMHSAYKGIKLTLRRVEDGK
jgi:hypothetical protein